MAHGDFSSYSCQMRRLLFLWFYLFCCYWHRALVNVIIFAAYSSQWAVYFEMCGQRWNSEWKVDSCQILKPPKGPLKGLFMTLSSQTCTSLFNLLWAIEWQTAFWPQGQAMFGCHHVDNTNNQLWTCWYSFPGCTSPRHFFVYKHVVPLKLSYFST